MSRIQAANQYATSSSKLDPSNWPGKRIPPHAKTYYQRKLSDAMARLASSEP